MAQADQGERSKGQAGFGGASIFAGFERKTRVLVVEDSPVVRTFLKRTLEASEMQAEVLTAEDGAAAMELLQTHPVDLVLCDLNMPNVSGREFCRWIRSRPHWHNLPIAICTADHHAAHEAQFLADPWVAILPKPSAGAEILALLGRLLKAR